MKTLIQSTLCAALLLAVPALAKTPPPAQTHHCVKDGAVLEKTHKECTKEGGKWEKMTAAKPAEAKPAEAKEPAKAEPAPAKADDSATPPPAAK